MTKLWIRLTGAFTSLEDAQAWVASLTPFYTGNGIELRLRLNPGSRKRWYVWRSTVLSDFIDRTCIDARNEFVKKAPVPVVTWLMDCDSTALWDGSGEPPQIEQAEKPKPYAAPTAARGAFRVGVVA